MKIFLSITLLALATSLLSAADMPAPATPSAAATAPAWFPDLKEDGAGYWQVNFQHLASFPFGHRREVLDDLPGRPGRPRLTLLVPQDTDTVEMPTEPGVSGTIPAAVQALDGKRVRLTGFMLPIRVEEGLVREWLLLRNQSMCCFGRQPELNEWVIVKMKGRGVPSKMDTPVTVLGTLHVGEHFEDHVFEGLYKLDAEKLAEG